MIKSYFVPSRFPWFIENANALEIKHLDKLVRSFGRPAVGFGKNSVLWQRRAIKAWDAVAREWEAWSFPNAGELLDRLEASTHMSRPVLRESLANHFRVITVSALHQWLFEVRQARTAPRSEERLPSLVFMISAGNIPGVVVQPLVQMSLLGVPTVIKSSSREPDMIPTLLQTLAQHDDETASRTLALSWPRENQQATQTVLAASPAVVAFGDDDTVAVLQPSVQGNCMPFGDRFSAAIIHASTLKLRTLRRLAYDYAMFDGKGCLSPQVVMVIAEGWKQVENLALHFAGIMSEEMAKWPPGQWSTEEKAMIHQWRGEWQARKAAGEPLALFDAGNTSWTVVAARQFDLSMRVAFRTVRLWWVKSFEEALQAIRAHGPKIQALAMEPAATTRDQLARDLDEQSGLLGRLITTPGELQRPHFGWMDINTRWFEMTRGVKL